MKSPAEQDNFMRNGNEKSAVLLRAKGTRAP